MTDIILDLFAEDRAHQAFLEAILRRIADEEGKSVRIRVRSARGGHGKVLRELKIFQRTLTLKGELPDILVVAIDGNCKGLNEARKEISEQLAEPWRDRSVLACPDPHIERWFLLDAVHFAARVGVPPKLPKRKCGRDIYKSALANAVIVAGHPPTLGGIEFAEELALGMDFFRAGKADRSFQLFVEDAIARIRRA